MSVSRPARCLLSKATSSNPLTRRAFHTSPSHCARRRVKAPSVKASDMGLLKPSSSAGVQNYKPYSEADRASLSERYTPQQISAIEAGESAIDPSDLALQGTINNAPMSLTYLDDFSTIRPLIDKPIRSPHTNYDPQLRFKSQDEIAADLAAWVRNLPENPDRVEWMKFLDSHRLTVGDEAAERAPRSALAPAIPKFKDPEYVFSANESEGDDAQRADPHMIRLLQQTGYSLHDIRRIRAKNLVRHRVVNQTRMGKISSQYYLTVAGNQDGLLGIGEGKAAEPEDARRQALMAAIRNMQPVPRYENRTIFGEVDGKVGAVELKLMSRPPGFGVRCQPYIFEMARCAGITDLAARVTRSRNPMNTAKATFQALMRQRLPEEIARARGKKLVDVRKVYYGGIV
ncbi:MAG: hypothetical protein M1819_004450 [Sarea resinae]|nr:MAG: hypothetical protein M1819_004450 [Sarea resinae]